MIWDRLEGQERAGALLARAAERPVHAYLLTGPPGSGLETAARCFAGALLCEADGDRGCGECLGCARALKGRHPDVVEVAPEGTEMVVAQAASVIEAAFRSPVEGSRKVIVVHEAERMNETAANKLLKTLEEPPASTLFVLLAGAPEELLDTVRSRCQEVALAPPAPDVLARRRAEGPYAGVAAAFGEVVDRLDGTGGAVATAVVALQAAIDGALERLSADQQAEADELEADLESAGYGDRVAKRMRKAVTDRHKREERRARADALAVGLAALEERYRDVLLGAAPGPGADGALAALDVVATARRALGEGIVLNWTLQLEALLMNLPATGAAAGTLADRPPG